MMVTVYQKELKKDKGGTWYRWLGEDKKGTKQQFRLGRDKPEAQRRLQLILALYETQKEVNFGGSWAPEHLATAKQIAKGNQFYLQIWETKMKSQKVVVEQMRQSEQYQVKRLVNRTEPKIGTFLTEKQVQALIDENKPTKKVTVEIVQSK
jgi:hypothetical protein